MFQTTESAFKVGVELKLAAWLNLPLQACRRRLNRVMWQIWDKAEGRSGMLFPSVLPSEIWSARRTNKFDGLNRKRHTSTAKPKAKHADSGRKPYREQQSQDNMSPEWQELLFASVELINDGSLAGSGSRWALSPWLPVSVSSLQATLAKACTSAMSRHECQPGMWWHSTIPLANYPAWREASRDKRGGGREDSPNKYRRRGRLECLFRSFSFLPWSASRISPMPLIILDLYVTH